jgi:hypothetical protein
MSVYVDSMRAPYGRMIMSHMVADTSAELIAMAARIGLNARWIQHAGTYREHFDVCQAKRALAVTLGAHKITTRELAAILRAKRNHHAAVQS